MYRGDPFFSLELGAAAGLLAVLALLAGGTLLALRRAARGRGLAGRIALACLGFWLFVWVAPQAVALWFEALAGGPPWDLVIDLPPGPRRMLALVTFSGPATLAAHGEGALFWGMVVMALRLGRLARF